MSGQSAGQYPSELFLYTNRVNGRLRLPSEISAGETRTSQFVVCEAEVCQLGEKSNVGWDFACPHKNAQT